MRVHRAGEGAPFTGLKPAGLDLGPAIPTADRALESGDVEPLVKLIAEKVRAGLRERFERARAAWKLEGATARRIPRRAASMLAAGTVHTGANSF